MTTKKWEASGVLGIMGGFRGACVLAAGAELGLFDALAAEPLPARKLASRLKSDLRATATLADALAGMGLLEKGRRGYALAPGVAGLLTESSPHSVLWMVRHQANCLRSWGQLAQVVKTGRPVRRTPSIRGPEADLKSFIEAMNDISRTMAPILVKAMGPLKFTHLLDLGGGPATWTIEFLRANPKAKATLFDRPDVLPIARRHIQAAGLRGRVKLVAGDMDADPLPTGADLAWISAIVHQNSREQNRRVLRKVHAALADGGQILVRDFVMDESRTRPPDGAMFAVNMLVHTPAGGTFTLAELGEDLVAAGFRNPGFLYEGRGMDSVVKAVK
jgi:ubiquinone/menaquinone biosynthesis C-methylase UbiE